MREEREKLGVDRFKEWNRDSARAQAKLQKKKPDQAPYQKKKAEEAQDDRLSFMDYEAIPGLQINAVHANGGAAGGAAGGAGGGVEADVEEDANNGEVDMM